MHSASQTSSVGEKHKGHFKLWMLQQNWKGWGDQYVLNCRDRENAPGRVLTEVIKATFTLKAVGWKKIN